MTIDVVPEAQVLVLPAASLDKLFAERADIKYVPKGDLVGWHLPTTLFQVPDGLPPGQGHH